MSQAPWLKETALFVKERCHFVAWVPVRFDDLYRAYQAWCTKKGLRAHSIVLFSKGIVLASGRAGHTVERVRTATVKGFVGICLN